ncbi:MAG: hypothetical protein MKZ94_14335 [Pirellulales bacterium]|nr:hypothetical protein [Pirellulales bacterium]
MKIAMNLLGMIALMLASLTTLAQDAAEPSKPMVVEEVEDTAETLPADTNQLLQELLIRLQQQDLRDPFAPDAVILKEQRRANNEFIEVGPGVNVPTVSLVGVVTIASNGNAANDEGSDDEGSDDEGSDDEEAEVSKPNKNKVASIRVEGRVYFVREQDRVTLTRSNGNLVIEISAIENGFVEVKLGTLAESVIIR